jgi:DNA replication protein DnaC
VHFERADQLFKRLKASRLDNSHDIEIRKLIRVDLLILDDLCLQALDAADTADLYDYAARTTMPRRWSEGDGLGGCQDRLSA